MSDRSVAVTGFSSRLILLLIAALTPARTQILSDEFTGNQLDLTKWSTNATKHGVVTVAGGNLVLSGGASSGLCGTNPCGTNRAEVTTQAIFVTGSVLRMAINSRNWTPSVTPPNTQPTDTSFGFEVFSGANGMCQFAVLIKGSGQLVVIRAQPDGSNTCTGDPPPGAQSYKPISNWDTLRSESRQLFFTLTWSATQVTVQVNDGGSNSGMASYPMAGESGQNIPVNGMPNEVLRIRLNADEQEQYQIDYVRLTEFDEGFEDSSLLTRIQKTDQLMDLDQACYVKDTNPLSLATSGCWAGASCLSVEANTAGITDKSVHRIAGLKVVDGQGLAGQGSFVYRGHAFIPHDAATQGQTGPEASLQSNQKCRTDTTKNCTTTAGLQYVANSEDPNAHNISIWTDTGNGVVGWVKIGKQLLAPDTWYLFEIYFDFSDPSKLHYTRARIQGGDLNLDFDLTKYLILDEMKGFAPSIHLTVEAENKYSCKPSAMQAYKYRVLYDDIQLTAAPPFGVIDTPVNGATGQAGAINFTGWALSSNAVANIALCRETLPGEPGINGLVYLGNGVLTPGARPDVAIAHPGFPKNDWGWGAQILTNTLPGTNVLPVGNGTYKLHAIASDTTAPAATHDSRDCVCTQSFCTDLGTTTISADNAHSILPFGTIDTPAQGQTISGADVVNFGWVLTPQPNIVPIDASTITVYIDNVAVGRPVYNQFRSDIASLFPGLKNSNGGVGYFHIDTTRLSNGIHNIAWGVTDSAGNAQGIGSRAFFVQN